MICRSIRATVRQSRILLSSADSNVLRCCMQTTSRAGRTESIEFRLQSSYGKNATIRRGCIRIEPCRRRSDGGGGRSQPGGTPASTLGPHKLALYVDDQYIDEHVVGARHVTNSSATPTRLDAPEPTEIQSNSAGGHYRLGFFRWPK